MFHRANPAVPVRLRNMICNYGTVPCAIGVALYILQQWLVLPEFATEAMKYIGAISTPISLMITGGLLATVPVITWFNDVRIYFTCAVKQVLMPFLVFFILHALPIPSKFALYGALMAGLPTATNSVMFAEKYDVAPTYAARMVGVSTFLSALTLPAVIYVCGLFV